MEDSKSLGEALPEEIKRCRELLDLYASLGPVGTFGKIMISKEIDLAVEALAGGDVVAMIKAYHALVGCE